MAAVDGDQRDPTRQRILDVALELITDQGYSATTTREISERLGFTKAALYYHFRTKDDLLTALVAPAVERLRTLVAGAPTDRGARARHRLLGDYVGLVAECAPIMRCMVQDPQVTRRVADLGALALFERLTGLLASAEPASTADRARVRAAMGAVHNVYRRSDPSDDPEVLREVARTSGWAALAAG